MLRLRPYIPSDARHILRWVHDETTFYRWSANKYAYYPIIPDDMNRAYAAAQARGIFYPMTAVDGDDIAGHLILRCPGADQSVVRFGFVIVDDAKRGAGYGREMLSLALAYAFSILRAEKVTLGVFADNLPAYRCYRALGFAETPLPEKKYYSILGANWECLELAIDRASYEARNGLCRIERAAPAKHPMRRADRAVTANAEISEILTQCKTCHLAMVDEGMPYVLPLSFGYEMREGVLTLWFHSAKAGRKIDILRRDNRVSFELCCEGEAASSPENPCNTGYYYASVLGTGRVQFVADAQEKCRGLSLLMERQSGAHITFTKEQAEDVCVFKVETDCFTGKRRPRK